MNAAAWAWVGNVCATFCLVGLIWTIQVVHYPAFRYASEAEFPQFARFHQGRISVVVVPLMLLELVTGLVLLWRRPDLMPAWAALAGALLLAIIWASTFTLQVPIHTQLAHGLRRDLVDRLVFTNIIRTAAWTARGGLLAWTLIRAARSYTAA